MTSVLGLAPEVECSLRKREPFLWLNPNWMPLKEAGSSPLTVEDVYEAERRLTRYGALLAQLFPELAPTRGIIESPLLPAARLQQTLMGALGTSGRWLIKADHALPVAGSIKARGGIYEVLLHAEMLALKDGFMRAEDDPTELASPQARAFFATHEVSVGSTGNLGLSIGVMAAALGFRAIVHMSSDAKEWKKTRLRARGVEVIEHAGDFGVAVSAGREFARTRLRSYFVDDENSRSLFLGYSAAAVRLKHQLIASDVTVDSQHPVFVYLPCGVGGAPGGITFGLRHVFDDHVHCFFAEPVASPCMLLALASAGNRPVSVREVDLDNRTEADGLAVGRASEFVVPLMRSLASGVFTVTDDHLFEDLYKIEQTEGLHIEPSAAAGLRGPRLLLESTSGRRYLSEHGLLDKMDTATHILWTTGGEFVPKKEYWRFHERGRCIATAAV
jgi:D-serine dehydratase